MDERKNTVGWQSVARDLEGRYVHDFAHRVNNLLMGISGCAEILSELVDLPAAAMYVSEIRNAALEGIAGAPPAGGASAADEPRGSSRGAGDRPTVLVLEDDLRVQMVIRFFLEQAGHRVLTAASSREALDCCARFSDPIGLLLTALGSPEIIDVREMVAEIRQRRPDLDTIYMSAHRAEELMRRGLLRSGERILTKPFSRHRLLDEIDAASAENAESAR